MAQKLYSTQVQVSGGRNGHARSSDGVLDLQLAMPREMGGKGGATNPEQLFAAGYSACFDSALRLVASMRKAPVTDTRISGTVELHKTDAGAYALAVVLDVMVTGVPLETARELVDQAHHVCPYSNAVRGNINVTLNVTAG